MQPTEGDWPEDFAHDNGNYMCHCVTCLNYFTGYKRRIICKVCANKAKAEWDAMTPEQQLIQTRENEEAVKQWLSKLT
jgi:hypothetical protein